MRRAGRRAAADGPAVHARVAAGRRPAAAGPGGLRAVRRCDGADPAAVLRVRHGHGQHAGHTLCRRRGAAGGVLPVGAVSGGGDTAQRISSSGAERPAALCGLRHGGGRVQAAGENRGLLPPDGEGRPGPAVAELRAAPAFVGGGGAVRRGVPDRTADERLPLGADVAGDGGHGRGHPADRGAAPVLSVPAAGPQRLRRGGLRRRTGAEPPQPADFDG